MENFVKVTCALLTLVLFTQASCKRNECDSVIPEIGYKDVLVFDRDSAHLIITFKDCDGNIGLADSDTTFPYSSNERFYYNFFVEYYELRNGNWVHRNELNPPFYYRVPVIKSEGQSKILEGEIKVTLEPYYFDPFSGYDTIKYSLQLADRELNESNVVETPPFIVPSN